MTKRGEPYPDLSGMTADQMAAALEALVFTVARDNVRKIVIGPGERTIIADALRGIHRED